MGNFSAKETFQGNLPLGFHPRRVEIIAVSWKIRNRSDEPPYLPKLGLRDADRTISSPVFIYHLIQKGRNDFFSSLVHVLYSKQVPVVFGIQEALNWFTRKNIPNFEGMLVFQELEKVLKTARGTLLLYIPR